MTGALPTFLCNGNHPQRCSSGPETYARLQIILGDVGASLQHFAQCARTTIGVLLQALWAILLARCCGQNDVVFGATVTGRAGPAAQLRGLEGMVGLFINTIPLRVVVPPGHCVLAEFVARVQCQVATLQEHGELSLAEVLAMSDAGRRPMFDTLFVFENFLGGDGSTSFSGSIDAQPIFSRQLAYRERVPFPLTAVVYPGACFRLCLWYERTAMTEARANDLGERFTALVRAVGDAGSVDVLCKGSCTDMDAVTQLPLPSTDNECTEGSNSDSLTLEVCRSMYCSRFRHKIVLAVRTCNRSSWAVPTC